MPVKKRPLTEEEKTITEKNIKRQKESKKWLLYQKEITKLNIEGIESQVYKERKEREKEKEELEKIITEEKDEKLKAYYNNKLAKINLILEIGLEVNAKKLIRKFKKELSEIDRDLSDTDFAITRAEDAIKNGVEIKEKKNLTRRERRKRRK